MLLIYSELFYAKVINQNKNINRAYYHCRSQSFAKPKICCETGKV